MVISLRPTSTKWYRISQQAKKPPKRKEQAPGHLVPDQSFEPSKG